MVRARGRRPAVAAGRRAPASGESPRTASAPPRATSRRRRRTAARGSRDSRLGIAGPRDLAIDDDPRRRRRRARASSAGSSAAASSPHGQQDLPARRGRRGSVSSSASRRARRDEIRGGSPCSREGFRGRRARRRRAARPFRSAARRNAQARVGRDASPTATWLVKTDEIGGVRLRAAPRLDRLDRVADALDDFDRGALADREKRIRSRAHDENPRQAHRGRLGDESPPRPRRAAARPSIAPERFGPPRGVSADSAQDALDPSGEKTAARQRRSDPAAARARPATGAWQPASRPRGDSAPPRTSRGTARPRPRCRRARRRRPGRPPARRSRARPARSAGSRTSGAKTSRDLLEPAEPREPGARQHDRVPTAPRPAGGSACPRFPALGDLEVRPRREELRPAARARRADARPARKVREGPPRLGNEDVARVLALRNGREDDARGKRRRHVLQAVDREVDPAVEQRLVELLREVSLPADRRAGGGEAVARRADVDDLDLGPRRQSARARHSAWSQRERAARARRAEASWIRVATRRRRGRRGAGWPRRGRACARIALGLQPPERLVEELRRMASAKRAKALALRRRGPRELGVPQRGEPACRSVSVGTTDEISEPREKLRELLLEDRLGARNLAARRRRFSSATSCRSSSP